MKEIGCPNCSTSLPPEAIGHPIVRGDKVDTKWLCPCCAKTFTWTESIEDAQKRAVRPRY